MKTKYSALIIFTICFVQLSLAQWNPEVQLTNNPNGVSIYGRTIAARNNFIHTVWIDYRHTDIEIYYRRSTDAGSTWEAESRFTNHAGFSYYPQIAVFISNVHVIWQDDRDGNQEIYYKRSTDDGLTWESVVRLTNDAASSAQPSLSISGSIIYASWIDGRNGNDKVFFKRSTDAGVTWGNDVQVSNGADGSAAPSIFAYASAVYVAWIDYRFGNPEILFKRSTDGGNNWGPETRLTNNSGISVYPSLTVANQVVNLFWEDDRVGHPEIFYKRSTDAGITWSADTRMTNGNYEARNVCSIVSGQNLHFVWEEQVNFGKEIFYNRSTDGGITWDGRTYITPAGGADFGYNPSITFSGSNIHTVWRDTRNSNANRLYYRQNPNNGNPTAITPVSSEIPEKFALSQNYPNPFNPNTNIGFRIAEFGFVSLKVYDIMGKEVAILVNENLNTGSYSINFDASGLASGMYFYKLTSGEFTDTKKLILVK